MIFTLCRGSNVAIEEIDLAKGLKTKTLAKDSI